MKKNLIIPLIVSIVLGFIGAQIVYSNYKDNLEKDNYNTYIIQGGVYATRTALDNAIKKLDKYLVVEDGNKYYLYLGITRNRINADKIKSLYANSEMDVYIKPTIIENVEFVSNLEQYDVLISGVDDFEDIKSINETALSDYEEMVLGNR